MKNNKRHLVKKRIHEIDAEKNYSGEASPYWDFMAQHHDIHDKVVDGNEDPIANPDVLSEEKALYNRPLSERGQLMLQAVQEAMIDLTVQQQAIVRLMHEGVWSEKEGQLVYTEQAVAQALGIARQTVNTILTRVKTKVRRKYEILKAAKE